MNRVSLTLSVVLLTLNMAQGAEPGVLIRDGKAHATIVVPTIHDVLAEWAATELQDVLSRMTNVTLPICSDIRDVSGNRILVGQTRWTDAVVSPEERASLGKEGFILRRKDRDIALAGSGPYGAPYATSELLQRLGARWYLPGPLGEVIPKLKEVRFDRLDVRQVPSFSLRWAGVLRWGSSVDWNLRNRVNRINDVSLPPACRIAPWVTGAYHTQDRLIPHSVYDERHPEFFALIDCKRSRDPDCKLCNSNEALPREIARRIGDILRADPGVEMIMFAPTDGQLWCQCDGCRTLDEPDVPQDQKYSRRQMVLYNRVAAEMEKEFPDTLLLVGAYDVYTWPPKDPQIKAHRNLAVMICHYNPYCLAHPVNDPQCEKNRRYRKLIATWQQTTPHVFFYEYYWKTNWLSLPWPIVHTVAADIPYYKSIGVEGLYAQRTTESIWSNFLVHYVAAKLLWDHTVDVDALLDEFYVKFYRRAAKPMKAYHEALERQMATNKHHIPGFALANGHYVFTESLTLELRRHLEEATRLARDELVKRRIEKIVALTDYATEMGRLFRLREQAKDLTGEEQKTVLVEAIQTMENIRNDFLKRPGRYIGVANLRHHHTLDMRCVRQVMGRMRKAVSSKNTKPNNEAP